MSVIMPDLFYLPISASKIPSIAGGRINNPVSQLYSHETNLLQTSHDDAVGFVSEFDDLAAVFCFEKNPNSETWHGWDFSAAIANAWWNKNLAEYRANPDRSIPDFVRKHCDYDLTQIRPRKSYHNEEAH